MIAKWAVDTRSLMTKSAVLSLVDALAPRNILVLKYVLKNVEAVKLKLSKCSLADTK